MASKIKRASSRATRPRSARQQSGLVRSLMQSRPTSVFVAVIVFLAVAIGGYMIYVTNAGVDNRFTGIGAHAGTPFTENGNRQVRCLDDAGGRGQAGDKIILWQCSGPGPAQRWTFSYTGANMTGSLSVFGKCLDVPNGSRVAGTQLRLWDCNGAPAQKWRIMADGSITNPNSGMCLDPAGGGWRNGTPVQIWHCNGSNVQQWVNSYRYGPVKGVANTCLDVAGGLNIDGQKIQVWPCSGNQAQTWAFIPYTNNRGGALKATLIPEYFKGRTGIKCLDIPNGSKTPGTNVRLWDCNASPAQEWVPRNGTLVNPNSGLCLDAAFNSTKGGTQMTIWHCNGVNGQKWAPNLSM